LAADAVTGAKIADDAVNSEHIAAGAVDTGQLAADAVTGAKIADDAVNSEHIAAGAVDTGHLASGAVDTGQLAADAVTGAKIADDAVNGAKIADNAINSEHYADGSIDTAHIADSQVTPTKTNIFPANSNAKVYVGHIAVDGTAIRLPSGWSSTRTATGNYTVTHNLGSDDYVVNATANEGTTMIVVYSIAANSFKIVCENESGTTENNNVMFTLIRY
jgi:hypothetical protein